MHLTFVLRSVFTLPVRQVKVTTCSNLYQRWRKEKLVYRNAPAKGLDFTIDYVDTKGEIGSESPVVLALHGAPGTYKDFTNVINFLTNKGVRVIAPNFPDCRSTICKGIFRNSAEERAELLLDFLKKVGVSKIDTLIVHSGAIYPGMLLYLRNGDPEIKSLAFLNPPGHRIIPAMRPYWIINTFVQLYFYELGRNILQKVGIPFLKIINVKVRLDKLEDAIMAACTMIYSGYEQFEEKLHVLRNNKTPTVMMFSEGDKLMGSRIPYDMAKLLGASKDQIWLYDKEGNLVKAGNSNSWLKVAAIKEGSHYLMWKFPDIVNGALDELIQNVVKKQL